MKKCPYCGKEYPDDATICIIDTNPLIDPNAPKVLLAEEEPSPKPRPPEQDPNLVYPDYQWRAKDAWKCIGILVCLWFITFLIDCFLFWIYPAFYKSGMGRASRSLLHYALELLAAAYFARTETIKTFLRAFSLDQKPTNLAWLGVTMALVIRFFGHFMYIHHWGSGVYNYDWSAFRHTLGIQRFFFLIPLVILAPLFEEPIYRGFLYKAFRGSYSIAFSTILIMAWTSYTHWSYYHESWVAAVDLTALTVVQCHIREKSPSLWDCIICHFVFNASSLFV